MSVPSNKVAQRKQRKAPDRRTPAIIEQRTPQPFIFGWGADLTRHQRESLKERIALIAGIALAVVLAGLLGFGWLQDNVIGPANVRAENNKAVAVVGKDTIRLGFFKRFEKFEANQLNNQSASIQQELATLETNPKKNATLIQELNAQSSAIQQQLSSLPQNALSTLIDNSTVLQRAGTAGVPVTPKIRSDAMTALMKQAGGRRHLLQFIQQSGLTQSELSDQVTANAVQAKLEKKLAASVPRYQTKVRASHILVAPTKHALAVQLYHEVLNGANFAALAKKYSQDTGSAKQGGDLGYFAHGAMVPQFDKAAFSMKVGQVRLIRSQYGWHIIKVTGRERAKLTPTEYQNAQQSAFATWLAKQQAAIHVERIMNVSQLPNVVTPNPLSSIPSSTIPQQVPNPAPQAPSTKPGTTGKSTTGKKSTGTSGTSKP